MVADAIHSAFDSFSSVIGLYGNRASERPADTEHPYGHRKFEYTATVGIATMMFVACFNLIHESIDRIMQGAAPAVTMFSFASILISMGLSLTIALYERRVGKSASSSILVADSLHSLSDVLASITVIAGLLSVELGIAYADPVAALIVSGLIAYAGYSIFREATSILVDRGLTSEMLAKIKGVAEEVRGVKCHSIRGRAIGDRIFLDMHVDVEGDLHVTKAHALTEHVEQRLKQKIREIEDVVLHVEPRASKPDRKTMP